MKLSSQSHSLIESALKEAICKFAASDEQCVVTDIHVQPDSESGELTVFDDNDIELSKIIVKEWIEYGCEDFYPNVERILKSGLCRLKEAGAMDRLSIVKPYSFVLVDEEKETVADLLLMDDDTLLVDDELLKGLDKELDDFLKELLEN